MPEATAQVVENLSNRLAQVEDHLGKTGRAVRSLSDEYRHHETLLVHNLEQLKKNAKEYRSGRDAILGYAQSQKKLKDAIKENKDELIKAAKAQHDKEKVLKQLRTEVEIATDKYGALNKVLGAANTAFHSSIGTALKLAGSTGAVGFKLADLTKASIDYTRSALEVSRQQTISGRTSHDLASSLQYVRDNTVLARTEFLKLSSAIQQSFVGILPSLQEQANLIETVGRQFGFNYEKSKVVFDLQSKFPSLFQKWEEGLSLIKKANEGIGTAEDEKRVELIKNQILSYAQLSGMGPGAYRDIIQSLTQLTSEEAKHNDVLLAKQKLEAQIAELQLEFAKMILPYQKKGMEFAIELIKVFEAMKKPIAVAAAGMSLLTGYFQVKKIGAFVSAMAKAPAIASATAGGLGKVALAAGKLKTIAAVLAGPKGWLAIAGGAAIWGIVKAIRGARDRASEVNDELSEQSKINKEIAKLSDEQREKYNEIKKIREESGHAEEDIRKEHQTILKEIDSTTKSAGFLRQEYVAIKKDVERQLEIIGEINKALGVSVDLVEKFGGRNKEAIKGMIAMTEVEFEKSAELFSKNLVAATKDFQDMDVDLGIDVDADISTQLSQLDKASTYLDKMNLAAADRGKIEINLANLQKDAVPVRQKIANIVEQTYKLHSADIRQQEQYTSKFEARLDAERRLMESAQFGMGASVDMMQKQVDLSYVLMQNYADMDKSIASRLQHEKGVAPYHIKAIQNARTMAEAEDYITNVMGARGQLYSDLNMYAHTHQEVTKKIMDQQQKIYDLTKDIREGYLDAIREMSFGAGEFEKIIGTQDMGVSQLMGTVKDVTGEAKLNTMKLGGMQSASMTAGGVGTDYAGQYTTGGARFLGADHQEARNERIYKYGKYKSEAEAVMKGKVPERRSEMAGGAVPGAQDGYIDPHRMEKANEDGSYKGVRDGIRDEFGAQGFGSKSFTQSMGINIGVIKGRPPGGGDSRLMQGGAQAGAMGAGILRKSPHHGRASGGYVPGVPGNVLPVPSSQQAQQTQKAQRDYVQQLNENSKKITNEFKDLTEKQMSAKIKISQASAQKEIQEQKSIIDNVSKQIAGWEDNKQKWIAYGRRNRRNKDFLQEARERVDQAEKNIRLYKEQQDKAQKKIGSVENQQKDMSAMSREKRQIDHKERMARDASYIQDFMKQVRKEQRDGEIKEEINKVRGKIMDQELADADEGFYRGVRWHRKGTLTGPKRWAKDATVEEKGWGIGGDFNAAQSMRRQKGFRAREGYAQEISEMMPGLRERRSKLDPGRMEQIQDMERLVRKRETGTLDTDGKTRLDNILAGAETKDREEQLYIAGFSKYHATSGKLRAAGGRMPDGVMHGQQEKKLADERTSKELSALGGQYVKSMGTLKGTPRERAMQAKSRATRAGLGSGVHHEDTEQYNENIKARKDAYEHVSNAQAKDVALSGVSTIHTKRQGHTSAAAARGEEASAAAQAEWQERRHEAEAGGIGMDEGGAGGGTASIIIKLQDGLQGQVEKAAGIAVQFESA